MGPIQWEIENFSCWNREIHGEKIECGRASLYPLGYGGNNEYLEVALEGGGKLTFIASDGSIINTVYSVGYLLNKGHYTYLGPKFTEVVARIKKKHLQKDRLILRWNPSLCTSEKVIYYTTLNDVSGKSNALVSNQAENAVSVLTKELMCLYKDNVFSDFELRCGTVSFPTHRAILSARSAVFRAMLSGDMKEAATGHVDVEDLDPHTLGRFLSFLYSGSTGAEALGWEEASKLYYAADKFQVPSLKSECIHVLCASVSLENVCDILALADRHQDEKLTLAAQDLILKNYNKVLGSEKWEIFSKTHPSLLLKTLTHFAKNNYVQKKCVCETR